MPGLGRKYAPDPRDANFPMRAMLPRAKSTRTYRYWFANGAWLDQGETSQCVAYSFCHWLEDGPVTQPGKGPIIDPAEVYREAQLVDEWPGPPPDYEGTSVRAGAKVLQARGFIASYHWARTIEDIVQALLETGPVVVGTNWYAEMMSPDPQGFLQLEGDVVGGHAYVLNGINVPAGIIRVKNSWGRSWSLQGHALLKISDVARLLAEDGEAALASEIRRPA